MRNTEITVLVLNNNFYGSYSSNQIFFEEINIALKKMGINVLKASSTDEAMEIYEKENICFSLCFSKYKYFYEGQPLYEKYKVLNYQWVSDNPLKMNIDTYSKWIKYIFIDDEYPLLIDEKLKNDFLYRPLGFLEDNLMIPAEKNGRVLVPCKIRNLNKIFEDICESSMASEMKKFIEEYNRCTSYIKTIATYFRQDKLRNNEDREVFFRLTNEYIRVEKRLWVIEHIDSYPVDILGDDYGNNIKNKNVKFIKPVDYSMMPKVINHYSYVINVDPNYHACIHDRFIKTVSSGSVCVTNDNMLISSITDCTYSFDKEDSIMRAIALSEKEDMYEKQKLAILPYSWENSAAIIVNDYLRGENENEVSGAL